MKRRETDTGSLGYPAVLFISPDGGLIQKASGFLPPDQFSPIMKDALKRETAFQEKLEKLEGDSRMMANSTLKLRLLIWNGSNWKKPIPFSEKAFEHPIRKTDQNSFRTCTASWGSLMARCLKVLMLKNQRRTLKRLFLTLRLS